MNDLVSIIIATYNSKATIYKALESVYEQSYQEWECIVVDGCSKDNTLEIVLEYEQKDNRFRHISEPDKGVFDALNKGVMLTKGEWIYVLGSDDRLYPDALENAMNIKEEDSVVLYGDAVADFGGGVIRPIRTKPVSFMKYNMITSHQAMLVRKSEMNKFGNFDLQFKLCADFDFFQKIYLAGAKFQYLKCPIAYYGMEGLSNGFSFKNDWDKYKVCKKNKSNACPLFFFILDETKWILSKIRNRFL